jgi:mRNA-degrading endonuclease toxin of MazEF toxin-antitoxin module
MTRGDIWTVAGGKECARQPRPVVIIQDDNFDATGSITVCAFTTDETDAPLLQKYLEHIFPKLGVETRASSNAARRVAAFHA